MPEDTFEEFYRHYYPRAVAVARVLAGARTAEDIAQDAFVAAYRRWDDIDQPEHWIMRVVANRSRSVLRRRYTEARAIGKLASTLEEVPELSDSTEEFWSAVRGLPRRQAQTVALVYVDQLSTGEVAEILGCEESTVRVHLHRARQKLARRYEAEI
ncbi:MAG: SigE family RNA polymerase sigma factor [Acidimicrobiia bacterium]|nr:MAG: SigE family RNA polymerase sigma factor [Acidimicrobiia bacterium]